MTIGTMSTASQRQAEMIVFLGTHIMIALELYLLSSCSAATTGNFVKVEDHSIQSALGVYSNISNIATCGILCTEISVAESSCLSFAYNRDTHDCTPSTDLTVPTAGGLLSSKSAEIFTINEYRFESEVYHIHEDNICRTDFLLPIYNISVSECAALHMSSQYTTRDFSYNADETACYPTVSQRPADFVCAASDKVLVYRKQTDDNFDVPSKLTITGPYTSSGAYDHRTPPARAFDGATGVSNHFISHLGTTDPWIKAKIGDLTSIVAGAKFHTRVNCCAGWVTNLHFLVSMVESDLDDDYASSLCSVYSGPPDLQLMSQNGRSVWFPCTLKPAKYLKIIMYTQQGQLTVSEFEIYGSVVTPAPTVMIEQIPEQTEPIEDDNEEGYGYVVSSTTDWYTIFYTGGELPPELPPEGRR